MLVQPSHSAPHCTGAQHYFRREVASADIDVIVVRGEDPAKLAALAGQGSELHLGRPEREAQRSIFGLR